MIKSDFKRKNQPGKRLCQTSCCLHCLKAQERSVSSSNQITNYNPPVLQCGKFFSMTGVHWTYGDKRFYLYLQHLQHCRFKFSKVKLFFAKDNQYRHCQFLPAGATVSKMNNLTEENTTLPNNNNVLEEKKPLALTIATYTVVVLGFCANSFICFAFACYRRIRTVHNYFVLNLAISDLLLIVSLCLFLALPAMEKTLSEEEGVNLGEALIIFEVFCASASIANLTIISYDRYYSVTKPLHYTANITRRKAVLFIVCIWGYALIVALLQLLYFLPNKDYFNYGYIPFLGLFNSVLPLAITLYCYITIFIIASSHLRNNPHRSQDPNAPTNILTKNLKISFHILVLVAPLLVCWSSYYAITVIEVYCKGCIHLTAFEDWVISMMSHILAAIDPIIYIFLTKDFRKILFGCFKSGNRPYSVSETFHLSTTKSTNSHALPATGSETRIIDEDQMASSYRRSWKCCRLCGVEIKTRFKTLW